MSRGKLISRSTFLILADNDNNSRTEPAARYSASALMKYFSYDDVIPDITTLRLFSHSRIPLVRFAPFTANATSVDKIIAHAGLRIASSVRARPPLKGGQGGWVEGPKGVRRISAMVTTSGREEWKGGALKRAGRTSGQSTDRVAVPLFVLSLMRSPPSGTR